MLCIPLRNIVEIYAASRDFAENAPEYAEAAKQVREEIRTEIQSYYTAKDGRKEFKTMKHQNFGEYILDLNPIFDKAIKRRDELLQTKQIAEKKWADLGKDKENVDELQYSRAQTAFLESQQLYENQCMELEQEIRAEVKVVRDSFNEHLIDFYTPSGVKIDNDVVNLLNSGIELNGEEIDSLITQSADNPTMLRIITDFCKKNRIEDSGLSVIFGVMARSKGEKELKIFDNVAHTIATLIAGNDITVKVWTKTRDRFSVYVDDAVAELNALMVKP